MSDGPPPRQDQPDPGSDPWRDRRNLAERLFPGPSNPRSKQDTEHVQRLLRSRVGATPPKRSGAPLPPDARPAHQDAAVVATAEAVAHLQEALDSQTELLRAILSSSVDSQSDARSTAQNSRTFAWAGTAIALLTLVATVVLIVNGG